MRIEECLEKNREESLRRRLEALRDCAFNIQRELDALKSADARSYRVYMILLDGIPCAAYCSRYLATMYSNGRSKSEIIEGTFTPKTTKGNHEQER